MAEPLPSRNHVSRGQALIHNEDLSALTVGKA